MFEFAMGLIAGLVVGAASGVWGYRYSMKKNPAAVEALAQKWKRAQAQAEAMRKGSDK